MNLLDLFGRRKQADQRAQPTAIDYVEWLLKHMLRTSPTEWIIDTRRVLPGGGPTEEDAPPCIPHAPAVINRLKILSGINPSRQSVAVAGTFERFIMRHAVEFTTQFQDDDEKSVCTIRFRFRNRKDSQGWSAGLSETAPKLTG
jgi:hypothetical protein